MARAQQVDLPQASGRHHRAWGLAFAVVLAVHLAALYWPRVTVQGPVSWTDKIVHPLLFLVPVVVGALWSRRLGLVAVAFTLHAPVSELIQHFLLPHRSGDPWDAAADLLGVLLGILVVTWAWAPSRRRRSGTPVSRW